jgi:hypothetical protein
VAEPPEDWFGDGFELAVGPKDWFEGSLADWLGVEDGVGVEDGGGVEGGGEFDDPPPI